MPGATLCINLARAKARWRHIMQNVAPVLPADVKTLHRIDAVDAEDVPKRVEQLSPLCRLRLSQRWRVCNGLQIDSAGAAAATFSHVRCWRWLKNHPHLPYVLILEDDCTLSPDFARTWRTDVHDLLLGAVDVVVLGYTARPERLAGVRDGQHYRFLGFEGMHCYAVTQRGAQRLLARVFPIQLHVDAFVVALMALGDLQGLVWSRSIATQSQWFPSAIGHYDWGVGYKRALPDVSCRRMSLVPVVAGCLLLLVVLLWKQTGRKKVTTDG